MPALTSSSTRPPHPAAEEGAEEGEEGEEPQSPAEGFRLLVTVKDGAKGQVMQVRGEGEETNSKGREGEAGSSPPQQQRRSPAYPLSRPCAPAPPIPPSYRTHRWVPL
jgi:hypothetical protein